MAAIILAFSYLNLRKLTNQKCIQRSRKKNVFFFVFVFFKNSLKILCVPSEKITGEKEKNQR